ncbi:MAG: hypothetical protein ACM3SP_27295 [Chloroflexota bacterium]
MKRVSDISAAVLLGALLVTWTAASDAASSGKGNVSRRGGNAVEHRSEKGALNSNSQWSADPDRGWVRADERHKMHDEKDGVADRVKQNNGKSKGKGKSKRF